VAGVILTAGVLIVKWPFSPVKLVDVNVMKRSAGILSELKQGDKLTAEDEYEIVFTPAEKAFVYVIQRDTENYGHLLFPNPVYTTQRNPVPSGIQVRIPHVGLEGPVGREVVIVGVARQTVPAPIKMSQQKLDKVLSQMAYIYRLEFQHTAQSP
jgi:hypothetical protein